jgi:hypothetical protein
MMYEHEYIWTKLLPALVFEQFGHIRISYHSHELPAPEELVLSTPTDFSKIPEIPFNIYRKVSFHHLIHP